MVSHPTVHYERKEHCVGWEYSRLQSIIVDEESGVGGWSRQSTDIGEDGSEETFEESARFFTSRDVPLRSCLSTSLHIVGTGTDIGKKRIYSVHGEGVSPPDWRPCARSAKRNSKMSPRVDCA